MLRSVVLLLFCCSPALPDPLYFLVKEQLTPTEAGQRFNEGAGAPLTNNAVNAGYTQQTVWIKLQPASISTDKKIMELTYPILDWVKLYAFSKNGIKAQQSGDFVPYHDWPIDHKNPAFQLSSEVRSADFLLFEVSSTSSLQVGLKFHNEVEFNKKNRLEHTFSGMFYGTFLIMIVYNFFIWLFVREKSHLYYIIFLIGFGLLVFTFQGYAFQNLWPTATQWNSNAILFFMQFALWAALSFQRHLLGLKNKLPRLDKAGQYLRLLLLLGMLCSLFSNAYSFVIVSFLLLVSTVVHLLCSSITLMLRGDRSAKLYFFAWCFLIVGSMINVAVAFDWLPPYFALRNAMQIGSVFEVALLSFTLGDRYQQILIEKEVAQEELLETRKRSIERQRKQLRSFFRFVPQDFISLLKKRKFESIQLGDSMEVKKMTILFADIRGFTKFAEKNNSEEVLRKLNSLLSQIEPIILKHGGFIDKYIGDAIMALFPRDPLGALKAAWEMNEKVRSLNESGATTFKMGIGVHQGPVILGSIGSQKRIDMTVIGDTVNTAARVESLTRTYDVDILFAKSMLSAVGAGFKGDYRSIDQVKAKGKSDTIEIFELLTV